MAETSGWRAAADIGGTFTDIVVTGPQGRGLTVKVLSTPDDYSRAIVDGLSALLAGHGVEASLEELVHATTVATNAILEGGGARTALVTTRGFRDVLELRRLRAPQLYNLRFVPPPPLVERRLRLEVDERLDAQGHALVPLDDHSVRTALERAREEGVEALAICLLHSYRNPGHELLVRELAEELLPGVFVSASVDVLPEVREYERTSTTVINAYVGPMVRRYLESLAKQLQEVGLVASLQVMQSNGGLMTAAAAARRPAAIIESGPAAGVIAAQVLGRRTGRPNLITFDMGGTTAKAAMVEDGEVSHTTEYEVGAGISISSRLVKGGGHALKLPVLDIAEVGAGGGSVVWIDRGGGLKVGPRSAGAAPGPACYGLGGGEPTVTDANLLLGYLNPRGLAGGALALDRGRAERALQPVADRLGLTVLVAAHGVHRVANASMIRALKAVSTYRGRDPRDFALLAFGGSGAVHAAGIARELGIGEVVVPPSPGLFSAVGLLEARPEHHFVQTFIAELSALDPVELDAACERLLAAAGSIAATPESESAWEVDLRYVGQAFELTLPAPAPPHGRDGLASLAAAFGEEHLRTYGHRAESGPVEVVNLRLVLRGPAAPRGAAGNPAERSGGQVVRMGPVRRAPEHAYSTIRTRGAQKARAQAGRMGVRDPAGLFGRAPRVVPAAGDHGGVGETRLAYFGGSGPVETRVLGRGDLGRDPVPGPLVVEEYDTTIVVPPGCAAALDAAGCVVLAVG